MISDDSIKKCSGSRSVFECANLLKMLSFCQKYFIPFTFLHTNCIIKTLVGIDRLMKAQSSIKNYKVARKSFHSCHFVVFLPSCFVMEMFKVPLYSKGIKSIMSAFF